MFLVRYISSFFDGGEKDRLAEGDRGTGVKIQCFLILQKGEKMFLCLCGKKILCGGMFFVPEKRRTGPKGADQNIFCKIINVLLFNTLVLTV